VVADFDGLKRPPLFGVHLGIHGFLGRCAGTEAHTKVASTIGEIQNCDNTAVKVSGISHPPAKDRVGEATIILSRFTIARVPSAILVPQRTEIVQCAFRRRRCRVESASIVDSQRSIKYRSSFVQVRAGSDRGKLIDGSALRGMEQ